MRNTPFRFIAIALSLVMAFSMVNFTVSADQPFMKAARTDLNQTLNNLRKATADKGGHRNKAIDLTKEAIEQINKGIAYDRRNGTELEFTNEAMPVFNYDQPFMQNAKNQLQSALSNLNKATADKGGHRNKAIDLVKDAIEQVNKGIAYDRNH